MEGLSQTRLFNVIRHNWVPWVLICSFPVTMQSLSQYAYIHCTSFSLVCPAQQSTQKIPGFASVSTKPVALDSQMSSASCDGFLSRHTLLASAATLCWVFESHLNWNCTYQLSNSPDYPVTEFPILYLPSAGITGMNDLAIGHSYKAGHGTGGILHARQEPYQLNHVSGLSPLPAPLFLLWTPRVSHYTSQHRALQTSSQSEAPSQQCLHSLGIH